MKERLRKCNMEMGLKRNTSNIKSLLTLRKTTFSLSKIDMDCMMTISNQIDVGKNLKKHKKVNSNIISQQRIISGLTKNSNLKDFLINRKTAQINKTSGCRRSKIQQRIDVQVNSTQIENKLKSLQAPLMEKPKISVKNIGNIVGYGVNSHQGLLSSVNQDRVCIVTNMNKSMISKKQVSFFGIFNGKNGVVKAEYYRDNFHLLLYRDEYFFRDMERAIQRTLIIIERNFEEDKREKEAKSEVTFILSVLMENIVFVIKLGELKPVFSMNFGQKIFNPFDSIKKMKSTNLSFNIRTPLKVNRAQPVIKAVRKIDEIDFVILGSEGLYQKMNQLSIGKKTWTQLLKGCPQSIYQGINMSTSSIMQQYFQQLSSKGASIILILFQNISQCFLPQQISLPYVEKEKLLEGDAL